MWNSLYSMLDTALRPNLAPRKVSFPLKHDTRGLPSSGSSDTPRICISPSCSTPYHMHPLSRVIYHKSCTSWPLHMSKITRQLLFEPLFLVTAHFSHKQSSSPDDFLKPGSSIYIPPIQITHKSTFPINLRLSTKL